LVERRVPINPQELRSRLAGERDRMLRRIESLEREFNSIVEAAAGVATDDEHDPEGTTIAFERAQVAPWPAMPAPVSPTWNGHWNASTPALRHVRGVWPAHTAGAAGRTAHGAHLRHVCCRPQGPAVADGRGSTGISAVGGGCPVALRRSGPTPAAG
jgi:hypothetical protein